MTQYQTLLALFSDYEIPHTESEDFNPTNNTNKQEIILGGNALVFINGQYARTSTTSLNDYDRVRLFLNAIGCKFELITASVNVSQELADEKGFPDINDATDAIEVQPGLADHTICLKLYFNGDGRYVGQDIS